MLTLFFDSQVSKLVQIFNDYLQNWKSVKEICNLFFDFSNFLLKFPNFVILCMLFVGHSCWIIFALTIYKAQNRTEQNRTEQKNKG